ncbi:MAG: hypothetical protein ACYC56_03990 [Candidatus Aquicultor sp.]
MSNFNEVKNEINEWTMGPVSKAMVDPMELTKMTAGYGIEQHQWTNYHHLMEMSQNKEIRELFARISLQEEEHQSLMGSLVDPETTPMEASMALEMTALQGFADAAQLEPNESCKMVHDYILLDHLTQAKSLWDTMSSIGTNPEGVVKGQIQIKEGRPWDRQLIPTNDLMKQHLDKNSADIMSFVNIHSLLANEEQLRNDFQMLRKMMPARDVRRLYNMVTAVENLHVTMLESLLDPMTTPLEYAMMNELVEIRVHQLGMQMAKNDAAHQTHEYTLKEDQQHLSWLRDAYSRLEQGDSSKFEIPSALFAMSQMSANDYIDQIMPMQMNMLPKGTGFEKAA